MKKLLGTLITAAAIGLVAPASAGGITVGTFNTGNCYPYLCNDSGTNSGQSIEYQQVYSASLFSGPTVINTITGFFDQTLGGSSFVLGGSYQYFWGYAPIGSVNNLSTNLASNYLALYSLMDIGGATFPGGIVNVNPTGAARSAISYTIRRLEICC